MSDLNGREKRDFNRIFYLVKKVRKEILKNYLFSYFYNFKT